MSSNHQAKENLTIEDRGESSPAGKAESEEPTEGIIVDQTSISDGAAEKAETLSADSSKTRSNMGEAGVAEKDPSFKVGDEALLPRKGGPDMIVTVVDTQQNPGTGKWEYQLKDSEDDPVNNRSEPVYEWIPEKRLTRMNKK